MDKNTQLHAQRAALAGCVTRMVDHNLKGKARDDAAGHYLAGAAAVAASLGFSVITAPDEGVSYVDVLETLAILPVPDATVLGDGEPD